LASELSADWGTLLTEGFRVRKGAPLTRTIARRLEQLETRAKEVAAAYPEPHSFCFIEPVNKRVTSTLTWENGKAVLTQFDPPRDRAEFEPMV